MTITLTFADTLGDDIDLGFDDEPDLAIGIAVFPIGDGTGGGGLSEQDVLDLLDDEGFVQQPAIDTINASLDDLTSSIADLAAADDVLSASITSEAANRITADNLLAPKANPTFTGTVTLPGNAAGALQATPLQQVESLIATAKSELLGGAPSAALDTLLELGARLLDDEDVVSALTTTVAGKLAIAQNLADLADTAQARINLGVRIGTDVQAYSATLATLAAITTTLYGRGFLSLTDAAAARAYLSLGTAATQSSSAFDAAGAAAAVTLTTLGVSSFVQAALDETTLSAFLAALGTAAAFRSAIGAYGNVVLGGGSTANLLNSANRYSGLFTSVADGTEANVTTVLPTDQTISDLYVYLGGAPTSGKSWTFTIQKNGSDTALTCTIADTARVGSDTNAAHAVSFSAGDTISLKSAPSNTPTAATMRFHVKAARA